MKTRLVPIVRRFAMLIVSMAILVVGSMTSYGAQAASQSRTPSPSNGVAAIASLPPTKVVHFSPSGIRGTLDAPADCWETSLAAPRANAWRCIVKGSRIYDPCFSTSPQANYMICDSNPTGDPRGCLELLL